MVDAEDLVLGEVRDDVFVHRLGAGKIVPERFLYDQAHPALGPGPLTDLVHDRANRVRRHGQVVDAVSLSPALLVELLEQLQYVALAAFQREVGGDVVHSGSQPLPDILVHLIASELAHGLAHLLAPNLGRVLGSGDSDHREVLGEETAVFERV